MCENRCVSQSYLQGRWRHFLPGSVLKAVAHRKKNVEEGRAVLRRLRSQSSVRAGLSSWCESASCGGTQGPTGSCGKGHRGRHPYTCGQTGEGLER